MAAGLAAGEKGRYVAYAPSAHVGLCITSLTAWGWLPSSGAAVGMGLGPGDGWPAARWGTGPGPGDGRPAAKWVMGPGDGRPAAKWGTGPGDGRPAAVWGMGPGPRWPACGGMGDGACTRSCQVVGSSVCQLTDGSPSAICWISSSSCVDTFSWEEDGPLIIIITSIITMSNYDFIS